MSNTGKTVLIFCAGDYRDDFADSFGACITAKRNDYFVIAADAGFDACLAYDIEADLLIGDFDSIKSSADLNYTGEIMSFPVRKDDTDAMLAIKEALQRGFKDLIIFGALGGRRFDHSFANIQALAYVLEQNKQFRSEGEKEARAILIGKEQCVSMFDSANIEFKAEMQGGFSLFAYSARIEGLAIKSAAYELQDGSLSNSFPLGVSNSFNSLVGNGFKPDVGNSLKSGAGNSLTSGVGKSLTSGDNKAVQTAAEIKSGESSAKIEKNSKFQPCRIKWQTGRLLLVYDLQTIDTEKSDKSEIFKNYEINFWPFEKIENA